MRKPEKQTPWITAMVTGGSLIILVVGTVQIVEGLGVLGLVALGLLLIVTGVVARLIQGVRNGDSDDDS